MTEIRERAEELVRRVNAMRLERSTELSPILKLGLVETRVDPWKVVALRDGTPCSAWGFIRKSDGAIL